MIVHKKIFLKFDLTQILISSTTQKTINEMTAKAAEWIFPVL
jgi:hypothetical protein